MNLKGMNKARLFFYITFFVCFFFVGVVAIATHGDSITYMMFQDRIDSGMDFFKSIIDAKDGWETGTIYPPLATLFFRLCYNMVSDKALMDNALDFKLTQIAYMLLTLFTVFNLLWLIYEIYKMIDNKLSKTETWLIIFLLVFSLPHLYQLERGNILILAVNFLFEFLNNYKSESKKRRHWAYICLALSFGIKVYTAIFGVLILKRKQWKEALWCILYAVLAFFVPILFIQGSIFENLKLFIVNMFGSVSDGAFYGFGYKVNLYAIFGLICSFFGLGDYATGVVVIIFEILVFVSAVIYIIFCKDEEKVLLALVASLLMILHMSFIYMLLYFIPCIINILKKDKPSKMDITYLVFLTLMFVPIPCFSAEIFKSFNKYYMRLNASSLVEVLAVTGLTFTLFISGLIAFIKKKKSNKTEDCEKEKHA